MTLLRVRLGFAGLALLIMGLDLWLIVIENNNEETRFIEQKNTIQSFQDLKLSSFKFLKN